MKALAPTFMSTSRILLIWLCLAIAGATLPLAGQQPSFRRFKRHDGLPQSQVTALLEDRWGFLWVGTNTGGVARLGASGFHTFAAAQGLRALFVRNLMEDLQGNIWVASQEGVSEIRGETVVNYGPAQGLPAAALGALALDGEGRVLVANRHGLFRKEGARFEPLPLPAPWTGRPLRRVVRDRASGLWLVDQERHLARWDAQGLKDIPLPPTQSSQSFRDLQADPMGQVWILCEEALYRMERGAWVPEALPGLPRSAQPSGLRFSPKGGYLIALGSVGLLEKDPAGRFQILDTSKGLPTERILVALRDRRGVLWAGSDGDGLVAQSQPGLLAVELAGTPGGDTSASLGAIANILELRPDRFLLASSSGLYQVDFGRGVTAHWTTRQGLPSNECWGLLADGAGGAWIGTSQGLAHWQAGRVQAGPKELSRNTVTTLVRDGDHILLGSEEGLIRMDDGGRVLSRHHLPEEVGDDSISTLVRHEGRLLLATSLGLWDLVDGDIRRAYGEAPFAQSTVTSLAVDSESRLWVGTMRGLHLFRSGRWESYGTAEGLPDEGINFITEVGPGRIAIGHNKGLTLLHGRSMHHLGLSQGLISEETNPDGFLVDTKGRLWIGMIGGVCILENARSFRNLPLSAPRVLDLRWPGGITASPDMVQVPPRPDFLDLSFDMGAPLVPSALSYEAFLHGVESDWRAVGQDQTLQYRNLGTGQYRFRLRASTDGLTWVESPPVIIDVLPAWHELWLIRALLALGLVFLLGWLLWLRMHTLARRSRELEETIDERTLRLAHQNRALEQAHEQIKRSLEGRLKLLDTVTHDLRSPLTTILLTMDRLRELAPDGTLMLDVMEREAHRIEALVSNLLDQSRSESLIQGLQLVPTLPAEVTEGFEDVLRLKAEARGLGFHLEVSPETEWVHVQADTATLHQVMLNLFENALKFTPTGGHVGLRSTVDLEEGTWSLEVWDTGRGLDRTLIEEILKPFSQAHVGDAAHGWGLGLSICQSIIDAHHGALKVDSEPGQGARFRMVLPLNPAREP